MSKNEKKTIIVAYASTGSGHQIAAEAIAYQMNKLMPQNDICLVDILDFGKDKNIGNKFVSATSGLAAPIFDFTWRKNFTGKILWAGGTLWPSFIYKHFEKYIINMKPDLAICTHQVCANVIAKARIKTDKKFPIVSIPTDYETEGLWPHKETDLFCVATQEMAKTLISRKVPEDKILVSGLPVTSNFRRSYNKINIREKLGLPVNKKIALVLAGAKEPGPYKNIRKTLNGAIKMFASMDWMHFVICVGSDAKYAKKLIKKSNKHKAKNISIHTYIDNLQQYMCASDIAIVKPGGLVITECACNKLPILLVGKTYAQENINRRYLCAMGAAEHVTTLDGLISTLCDIFTKDSRYKKLQNNLSVINKKDAANKICIKAIELLESQNNIFKKHSFGIYIGRKSVHTR